MGLTEHLYSVLVVSGSEKFNRALIPALPESRYSPVRTVSGVGAAKRELLERAYDIVVINTPLPDDYGTRLAIDLSADVGLGVLMFVKSENYGEVCDQVSGTGVLTVPKPANGQLVLQSLILLCATRDRLRRIEQKSASIEEKMEEIRLVNRAKWLLIDKVKMTESDAHRYIERQAMNGCVSKKTVAEKIISQYS